MIFLRNLFSVFLIFVLTQDGITQTYDPGKVNKKAIPIYNQAIEKAQDGNFKESISLLEKCISLDNKYLEAYLSLAGVYGQLKNYQRSIEYYESAFSIDINYSIDYKLPYSINLAGLGEFRKALDAINELLATNLSKTSSTYKSAEFRKRSYEFALEYEKKYPAGNYVFTPVNIGDGVNTTESEYFPSLAIDGNELIFTRRLRGMNEDFFVSGKKYGDPIAIGWDIARSMPGSVNTDQNEGAQMISQDGEWLVFTGCNRPDGFGSCDIYISYLTSNGWTAGLNLGGRINSDQWDSQPCLSPDKRDLYFTSRRFGGYGGSDIYVSRLQPNGRWGEPENLGPTVNTPGDEQSPFMHADNQTLYFNSNYWPGYGDEDLFLVRKGPNNVWSNAVNLGYPINTINREGTLFIAANGKTAYYASDRSDSRGGLDIYTFELREEMRPAKTLWVKGRVFDKNTLAGLPSAVELIDLNNKQLLSKIQTDETGNYLMTLPVGKDYVFNVNRKGYLFYSDNFLLSKNTSDSIYIKNIPLIPIETGAAIVLKNIFFDSNKFDLKSESQAELDKLIQLLNDNPTLKIQISGFTDNVGKPAENLMLSDNRAKAVVNYLVSNGIVVSRLTSKGYGETDPVSDNKTEEGRALNRRTAMKVLSH